MFTYLARKGSAANTLLLLLCALAAYFTVEGSVITIRTLFKLYFLAAFISFISTYNFRYKRLEIMMLTAFVMGSFFLLSYRSAMISFCAITLMITSSFGFVVTRIRPDKATATAVMLSLISVLLYFVSPDISLIMLLMLSVIFYFRSDERSIEAFIMLFILPAVFYLSVDHALSRTAGNLFFFTSRAAGLAFMLLASLMTLSLKTRTKRMISFSLFYLGHSLFAMGMDSPEALSISLILIFMMPFIYSSEPDMVSIPNMAILPISPAFIAKIVLMTMLVREGLLIESGLILACSLVIMTASASDLSNIVLQPTHRTFKKPLLLQTVSVLVILLSIIYLDTVKNVIKITVGAVSG